MIDFPNGSFTLCLQLNRSKRPLTAADGTVEELTDEDQLDRIFSRTGERVFAPGGAVPARCIVPISIEFHNPYVFMIVKQVDEDTADMIKEYRDMLWNDNIKTMKDEIDQAKIQNATAERFAKQRIEKAKSEASESTVKE